MRLSVIAAFAVLLAAPAGASEPLSEPVPGEWIVATFKQVCVDHLGDRAKLVEAVSRADPGFAAIDEDPARPVPGTSGWQSAKATLSYSDGNSLPRALPSPQCILTARPAAGYDHSITAAALATALGLAPAKVKGKTGRFTSEWSLAGLKGEKKRLFLSEQPGPDGTRVRVSLLNLR